jgi:ribosomal protein S16
VVFTRGEAAHAEKDGNKHLLLNFSRAKYWLALGAVPSETVARIFGQVGVMPELPMRPRLPKATKNADKWRGDKAKA